MSSEHNLRQLIAENRIIRGEWKRRCQDGRELFCWLSAVSRDVARDETVTSCPASLMPQWAAYMIPGIDDSASYEQWAFLLNWFADAADAMPHLTETDWRAAQAETMIAILDEALGKDADEVVLPVRALWQRVLDGDKPEGEDWVEAAKAASEDMWTEAAAEASVWAAKAWMEVPWTGTAAAAAAAATAAARAARAAAAATVAEAAARAARAASAEARAAVWDRIGYAFLASIIKRGRKE